MTQNIEYTQLELPFPFGEEEPGPPPFTRLKNITWEHLIPRRRYLFAGGMTSNYAKKMHEEGTLTFIEMSKIKMFYVEESNPSLELGLVAKPNIKIVASRFEVDRATLINWSDKNRNFKIIRSEKIKGRLIDIKSFNAFLTKNYRATKDAQEKRINGSI